MRFAKWLSLALLTALYAWPAAANVVADMRVIGDSERTRFIVDLEKSPDYQVRRLANPYRLVIDLSDVDFTQAPEPGEGRGLIADYRYGLFAEDKARIVLDLSGPVDIVGDFVLDPMEAEPARLVLDLEPTSAEAYEAAVRGEQPQLAFSVAPERRDRPVSPDHLIVVIDPGHGGIDAGATGEDGLREKDVTLEFGLELARLLDEGGKLEPILTRDGDTFLSLPDRVALAQQHQAALFISIHADSVRQDYVRGATVYTLSDDASDELAAALADRENRSDILAGLALEDEPDEVADILFDLALQETRTLSVRFANALVEDMDGVVPLNSNPWRRAAFRVLKAPDVPSVLLELGYLSNPEDEKLFHSEEWPENGARAVAEAIEEFFAGRMAAGQ